MGSMIQRKIVQTRVWIDPSAIPPPELNWHETFPVTVIDAIREDMNPNSTPLRDILEEMSAQIMSRQPIFPARPANYLMTFAGVAGAVGAIRISKDIPWDPDHQDHDKIPTEKAVGDLLMRLGLMDPDGTIPDGRLVRWVDIIGRPQIYHNLGPNTDGVPTQAAVTSALQNLQNELTAVDTDLENRLQLVTDRFDDHRTNMSNPHNVSLEQVGAASQEVFQQHIDDPDNPHRITKYHLELDQVDNTSDEDKPISIATEAALTNLLNMINELQGDKNDLNFVVNITYDRPSGNMTVTFRDGSTLVVHLPIDGLLWNIDYDIDEKELILIRLGGGETRLSVADLFIRYLGSVGTQVTIAIDGNQVTGDQIIRATINNESISSAQLASAAVTNRVLADQSVSGQKIRNLTITTVNMADESITMEKIAASAVTTTRIADGAVTAAKIFSSNTDGRALITNIAGTNAIWGQIDMRMIANNAIRNHHIQNGAVGTGSLADGAVVTDKLADEAVTTPKLGNLAVTNAKISNSTITGNKLANGITMPGTPRVEVRPPADSFTTHIPDTRWVKEVVDGWEFTNLNLANRSVDGRTLFSTTFSNRVLVVGAANSDAMWGRVNTHMIEDGGVMTTNLADDAVTNTKIASDAIQTRHVADNSIITRHIAPGAVDGARIFPSVTANRVLAAIASNGHPIYTQIMREMIANNAINGDHIEDRSIPPSKIQSSETLQRVMAVSSAGSSPQWLQVQSGMIASRAVDGRTLFTSNFANRILGIISPYTDPQWMQINGEMLQERIIRNHHLAADFVVPGDLIPPGSITGEHIPPWTIQRPHIAPRAVGAIELFTSPQPNRVLAVDSMPYSNPQWLQVVTDMIADRAITREKIFQSHEVQNPHRVLGVTHPNVPPEYLLITGDFIVNDSIGGEKLKRNLQLLGSPRVEIRPNPNESSDLIPDTRWVKERLYDLANEWNTHFGDIDASITNIHEILNALNYVRSVTYDKLSGNLTFTTRHGQTLVVNIPIADLFRQIWFDYDTYELVLVTNLGEEIRVDLTALIYDYQGSVMQHIQISIGDQRTIEARILENTITGTELMTSPIADRVMAVRGANTVPAWQQVNSAMIADFNVINRNIADNAVHNRNILDDTIHPQKLDVTNNFLPRVGIGFSRNTQASGTTAYIIALPTFVRQTGSIVRVHFQHQITTAGITMDVNSTGASPVRMFGVAIHSNIIPANSIVDFLWNGDAWEVMIIKAEDSAPVGFFHNTQASGTTAYTAAIAGFMRPLGASVRIRFANAVTTAGPTLNVNGTGDGQIRFRQAGVPASTIPAGTIVNLVWDGHGWEIIGTISSATANRVFTVDGTANSNPEWRQVVNPMIADDTIRPPKLDVTQNFIPRIGHGWGTTGTQTGADRTVDIPTFVRQTGSNVQVLIPHAVTNDSFRLNVGGSGLRPVHHRGGPVPANTIPAGTTLDLVYDSSGYWQILDMVSSSAANRVLTVDGTANSHPAWRRVVNLMLADMPANTFKGRLDSQGEPQDLTVDQMRAALRIINTEVITTAGTANNYTATIHLPGATTNALTAGRRIRLRFHTANTSNTVNLNINGLGNMRVYRFGTTNPIIGQIETNSVWELESNGTTYVLVGAYTQPIVTNPVAIAGTDAVERAWTPQRVAEAIRGVPMTGVGTTATPITNAPIVATENLILSLNKLQGQINNRMADVTSGVGLTDTPSSTTSGNGVVRTTIIAMGEPSTLTPSTSNSATGTTHTHNVTTSDQTQAEAGTDSGSFMTPQRVAQAIHAIGRVHDVTAGDGLTGGGNHVNPTITMGEPGTITNTSTNNVTATSHTHELQNTGVTAGTVGSQTSTPGYAGTFIIPRITVQADGRVTALTAETITMPSLQTVTAGDGLTGGGTAQSVTVSVIGPADITHESTSAVQTDGHSHLLANNAVRTAHIYDRQVTGAKIALATILNENIAANTVGQDRVVRGTAHRFLRGGGTSDNTWQRVNLAATGTQATAAANDEVTGRLPFTHLAQIAARSVLGVAGNSTADVAPITAANDHQILRRNGADATGLAFGSINLNHSNAVGTSRLRFENLTRIGVRSVLGVSGTTAADMAEIAAGDNQVLRTSGNGALQFGTVTNAMIATNTVEQSRVARGTNNRFLRGNTDADNTWGQIDLSSDAVTGPLPHSLLANIDGHSVLGVSGATAGAGASITAGDHQVLRRSGTTLGFGQVALNQSAAVTGTLPVGNGGTGMNSSAVRGIYYGPSTANQAMRQLAEPGSSTATDSRFLEARNGQDPRWRTVDEVLEHLGIDPDVTDIEFPITAAQGGTGRDTLTDQAILAGNGTGQVRMTATANGAFFATQANGAASFGTLPLAQGGIGRTSTPTITVDLAATGNPVDVLPSSGNVTVPIGSTRLNVGTGLSSTATGVANRVLKVTTAGSNPAWAQLALADMANIGANTVLMNNTASDAAPIAVSRANFRTWLQDASNRLVTDTQIGDWNSRISNVTGNAGITVTTPSGTPNVRNVAITNSITAGSTGPSADANPGAGNTFTVPQVTFNAQGLITATNNRTITMPAVPAAPATITDAEVDSEAGTDGRLVTVDRLFRAIHRRAPRETTANRVLRSQTTGIPTWGSLNLGTDVTGDLPLANTPKGNINTVLRGMGTTTAPAFGQVQGADITTSVQLPGTPTVQTAPAVNINDGTIATTGVVQAQNALNLATSTTASGTAAKVADLTNWVRVTGRMVVVHFSNTDLSTSPTLNVNGTGAAGIRVNGQPIEPGMITANFRALFIFDGTHYQLLNLGTGTGDEGTGDLYPPDHDEDYTPDDGEGSGTPPGPGPITHNSISEFMGFTTYEGNTTSGTQLRNGEVDRVLFIIPFKNPKSTVPNVVFEGSWRMLVGDDVMRNISDPVVIATTRSHAVVRFTCPAFPANTPTALAYGSQDARIRVLVPGLPATAGWTSNTVETFLGGTANRISPFVGFTTRRNSTTSGDAMRNGEVNRVIFAIPFRNFKTNAVPNASVTFTSTFRARMGGHNADTDMINLTSPTVLSATRGHAIVMFTMNSSYPANSPCHLVFQTATSAITITPGGTTTNRVNVDREEFGGIGQNVTNVISEFHGVTTIQGNTTTGGALNRGEVNSINVVIPFKNFKSAVPTVLINGRWRVRMPDGRTFDLAPNPNMVRTEFHAILRFNLSTSLSYPSNTPCTLVYGDNTARIIIAV